MRKIKQMINDVLDKQEQKGIKTYGQTLEDCPDYAYDWQNMALEELVDAVQYLAKENLRLQKENQKFRESIINIADMLDSEPDEWGLVVDTLRQITSK